MEKQILNYSDFLVQEAVYGLNTHGSKKIDFFGREGWCPFCKKPANSKISNADSKVESWGPWHERIQQVWECECGWWQIRGYSYLEEQEVYKDWMINVLAQN